MRRVHVSRSFLLQGNPDLPTWSPEPLNHRGGILLCFKAIKSQAVIPGFRDILEERDRADDINLALPKNKEYTHNSRSSGLQRGNAIGISTINRRGA